MTSYVIQLFDKNSEYNGQFVHTGKDNYTNDIRYAFKANTFAGAKRFVKEPYEAVVPLDDIKE